MLNRHLSHANVLVLVFPLVYPLTLRPILYLPGLFSRRKRLSAVQFHHSSTFTKKWKPLQALCSLRLPVLWSTKTDKLTAHRPRSLHAALKHAVSFF